MEKNKSYFSSILRGAREALNAKDYTKLNEWACIVSGIADPNLTAGFGHLVSLDKSMPSCVTIHNR